MSGSPTLSPSGSCTDSPYIGVLNRELLYDHMGVVLGVHEMCFDDRVSQCERVQRCD